MSAVLDQTLTALAPQVAAFAVAVFALFATWAVVQLKTKLKVDTNTALYQSLYRTIGNAATAALAARSSGAAGALQAAAGSIVDDILKTVKADNAEAVGRLGESDDALRTKILAALPDAQAKVATARAATAAAADVTSRPLG